MKIKEISLKNFGKYKNSDHALEFKDGVNVVYGENEAGKSTLFNGVLTLLYGFKPANRESHPYLGWGQNRIEVEGVFTDEIGDFTVERRLLSSPIGQIIRDDKPLKINNKALDHLQNVSKQTYESIYALSLQDVVKMQDTPWSEIEDRLILNYGIEGILSPRELLQQLDGEMKKLFNPRGQARNTRVKRLENELKTLRKERKQILENQSGVLEKEAALLEIKQALKLSHRKELHLEEKIQWWEKHAQVIELTTQIEGLNKQILLEKEALKIVPENILTFKMLEVSVQEEALALKALEAEKASKDKEIRLLTAEEGRCVEYKDRLQKLIKKWRNHIQECALHEQKYTHLQDKVGQLQQLMSDLVANLSQDQENALIALNLLSIEGKIERVDLLKREIDELQKEVYAKKTAPTKSSIPLGLVSLAAGLSLFMIGLYLNQDMIKYASVLLLSFGGFKLFENRKTETAEDIDVFKGKIDFNEKKLDSLLTAIEGDLGIFELDKIQVVESGQRLLALLKQGKKEAVLLEGSRRTYQIEKEALDIEEKQLMSAFLELELIQDASALNIDTLESTLENGLQKYHHNKQLIIKVDNLQQGIDDIIARYKGLEAEYKKFKTYLLEIGHGQVASGLKRIEAFNRLNERQALFQSQLEEKDPGCLMRDEINKHTDDLVNNHEQKLELQLLKEEIHQYKINQKALEVETDHLLQGVDLFDVDSQLLSLEEALEEAKESYDQLLALYTIVSSYDRAYREEHQPDIHKRTGRYFGQITRGKYERVYNDELIGKTALLIRQEDEEREADVTLSQGTRDQLYLALRLALADELDKDQISLPLFLDEIFVNWDMPRLEEGLKLVSMLSSERQIVLFTCHEWMVEKLKHFCNAHIIYLETQKSSVEA